MNSKKQYKRFAQITEKTATYITVDKPTKRRKSVVLSRCEDLMEALWQDGYHDQVTWDVLRHYVTVMVGGFRTTVADYLGKRASYYTSRGREGVLKSRGKQGYLERFGFVVKFSPKFVNLLHENVGRDYHCEQTNIVNFSLSLSQGEGEREEGAIAPTTLLHTTTTQREREIQNMAKHTEYASICEPMLTKREKRVLEAAKEVGSE